MFRLIFNKLSQTKHGDLSYCHGYLFSTVSLKHVTEIPNQNDVQLITSKKSQKSAVLAAGKVQTEVLNLMRIHGLSEIQIKSIITKRPLILLADVDRSIKQTLELFKSMGISSSDIARMFSKNPRLFENHACTLADFFRANGFSEKQIFDIITKRPLLFTHNAQKSYQPKLDYFKSLGFSDVEIASIVSCYPDILRMSLENHIIPRVEFIMNIVGTHANVLKVIKRCNVVFDYCVEKRLESNMSNLRSHNVPQESIVKIFIIGPKCLLEMPGKFNEAIGEVLKLGIDPNKIIFLLAIRAMTATSKALWEHKLEVYRSFGWSDNEIISAFKLQPMFMTLSEKKIRKMMCFFIHKLNMMPSMVSTVPNLLLLSLEKRIIPRCSVLELLLLKKLIERDLSIVYALKMTEKMFVQKIVRKFQHLVPDVVEAYNGKRDFHGFPYTDLKM